MGLVNAIQKYLRKRAEKRAFARASMAEVFTSIYHSNKWGDSESVSGKGSNLAQTGKVRAALPTLLARHKIRSMLDLPCGDFHWMKEVNLEGIEYTGADIVAEMIEQNRSRYGRPGRRFLTLDLTQDTLPAVDLLLCRDCWVHLNYGDIARALGNIRRSGILYLLLTTFTHHQPNQDKLRGKFRMLNLGLAPFHFPQPIELILEDNLENRYSDTGKSLALWKVSDLPEFHVANGRSNPT